MQAAPKYATAGDWADSDFTEGDPPPDVEKLLNRASRHIDTLARNAIYQCDEDGYPVDANLTEAFRDATIAQAAYWLETGDVSGAGAAHLGMSIGSVSIGGIRTNGDTPASKNQSRHAPEALDILQTAGLVSTQLGRRL